MKTILLLLLLVVFGTTQAQVKRSFNKTAKAPFIDGIVDDNDPWSDDAWMDLAFSKGDVSTSFLSAKMQMLFSKDILANSGFIYLVVDVQDELPFYGSNSKEASQSDAVEIFFDMDTNAYANQGAYKNGSWHIRCCLVLK